ncbi:MAG: beta-glucosidase [Cellulomonadaceae bacterium]|nr:beta-glucosidase [Cellulomonadaceae bacterium]
MTELGAEERRAIALADWSPLVSRAIPAPHYVDAGTGLRGVEGATAFPAGVALAATFDAELAREYGSAVGVEVRRAGFTVLLGPTLDLARDPRGGRTAEAFGEDAYLSGVVGAAHVRGVQENQVISQLKHYVAYGPEHNRTGTGLPWSRTDAVDVRVAESLLRDVYLKPFQMAVGAGAWSIMGSYNRLNGEYVCESPSVLAIPRREWGWRGFYCPDYMFAVRDDAAALSAGMDVGALDGPGGRTEAMLDAAGPSAVESIVQNVVRALIGSGLVDRPVEGSLPPSDPTSLQIARRTAVAGSVLLTNKEVLPLSEVVRRVAVIGPAGEDALYVAGGAASVSLDRSRITTPADAIVRRAGGQVEVVLSQGSLGDRPLPPVPDDAFLLPDGGGPGVQVTWTGADSVTSAIAPRIDFSRTVGELSQPWPSRWSTHLVSDTSGRHRLSLAVGGRATVRLDGRTVMEGERELEQFIAGPPMPLQCVVELEAGVPVPLEIDYDFGPAIVVPPEGLGPSLRLGWDKPTARIEEAVRAAAEADVAIVFVNAVCGEGMDRSDLALPGDQDELVERVAAANPRTVVVLNVPGPVAMPWIDDVAAALLVWYPGEQFGPALASMIFGDDEPGGRLPVTFPFDISDVVGESEDSTGLVVGDVRFGYQSTQVQRRGALFPFGFGLQYAPTACAIEQIDVVSGVLQVTLRATNGTARAGEHVAQIYAEVDGVPQLIGLVRVPVPANGSAVRDVSIGTEQLARWDAQLGRDAVRDGRHIMRIAASSVDVGHAVAVNIRAGSVLSASLA